MKPKKAGAPALQSESPLGYLPGNQSKDTNFTSKNHRIIRLHFPLDDLSLMLMTDCGRSHD